MLPHLHQINQKQLYFIIKKSVKFNNILVVQAAVYLGFVVHRFYVVQIYILIQFRVQVVNLSYYLKATVTFPNPKHSYCTPASPHFQVFYWNQVFIAYTTYITVIKAPNPVDIFRTLKVLLNYFIKLNYLSFTKDITDRFSNLVFIGLVQIVITGCPKILYFLITLVARIL